MPADIPVDSQLASWVSGGLIIIITTLSAVVRHLYTKIGTVHDAYLNRIEKLSGDNQDKLEKLIAEFTEQSVMVVERQRENNDVMKRNNELFNQVVTVIKNCDRKAISDGD